MSGDLGSRWYVAQTHPHAETKASEHLGRQGFPIYLPRYLRQLRHARRVERRAVPLFPRYVFVSIDMTAQRWLSIDSTIGVTKLLRNGDVPTQVPAAIIDGLGLNPVMFEAADPKVFEWYIKNYGAEVNLFVDHSQIVQLECLRSGLWGTKSSWGRITTYKP